MSETTTAPRLLDAARQLASEAVAVEAYTALREIGADPILLKGRNLAERLYDDPAERPSSDVDLLIEPTRERAAIAALKRVGYSRPAVANERDFSGGQMWVRSLDAPPVDLHSRLGFVRLDPEAAFALLRSHTNELVVGGTRLTVFDPPAMAVHLCLHAVLDRRETQRVEEDLRRAHARLPSSTWTEAATLADALDALDAFAAGLRLTVDGERLAAELGLPDRPRLPVRICMLGATELATGLLTIIAARGAAARARQALRLLVPPAARQRARWSIARKGRVGLFASYLAWPFYLVVRLPGLAFAAVRALLSPRASKRASSAN